MTAKCGEVRDQHWAHKSKCAVDRWWEPEGEWHRAWKSHFPESWQEIVHAADNGEKHIADVKTSQGWVIEFQHSHITPEERRSRDAFYRKLVWVVNGVRLKRTQAQFMKAWENGVAVGKGAELRRLYIDDCALLREWAGSESPIFFDFGEEQRLWWLLAHWRDGWVYVGQFSRAEFIETLRGGTQQAPRDFGVLMTQVRVQITNYEAAERALASQRAQLEQQQATHRLLAWSRRRGRF